MSNTSHFDQRGSTYDASETHQHIISLLLAGATLKPGMRVLDIATGTGAAAFAAAPVVGPHGSVLAFDISDGMLNEARRKLAASGLHHLEFVHADAEELNLPEDSFDLILCASALIMMQDIPAALRRWSAWLPPDGAIACDMPAKPFGIAQVFAEAAATHGIELAYDTAADTPEKCRALLHQADFAVTAIETHIVSDERMELSKAIASMEERIDHPAWSAVKSAPGEVRAAIRETFIASITRRAKDDQVQNTVAQHFVYGRKR